MSKVKVKKQSTFIDMTAMSDVTVLLLTFFMLTSTFISKEPIQVTTPSSVSEFKIPETNLLTILVDKEGKIFLSLDNDNVKIATLKAVGEDYSKEFTNAEINAFKAAPSFGVPIATLAAFLDKSTEAQDKFMQDNINSPNVGIPAGDPTKKVEGQISNDNEFQHWVLRATETYKEWREAVGNENLPKDLQLAIKADAKTPYPVIKKVMDDLRDLRLNRYKLITSLKTASSD
ncbi:biopolymer transporter ExbD [Bacteroidia bacterium]|nr:biopolymer transporter ExbD [Bacteroidia bacterium]